MTDPELVALLPFAPRAVPAGVLALPCGALTAILADAPLPEDRVAAARTAVQRHQLYEALLPGGPVLPLAPGAQVGPGDLPALIEGNAALIARAFDAIGTARQFQLQVDWNRAEVLTHFRTSPELKPIFDHRRTNPVALAGAVGRLAERLDRQIHATLAPLVRDIADLPRAEETLCHLALLCAPEADLDPALAVIDDLWSEGFRIRLVGPTAPVSFALLRLQRHGAMARDAAADCLGLAAAQTHPAETVIAAARARLRALPPTLTAEAVRTASRVLLQAPAPSGETLVLNLCRDGRSLPDRSFERVA